MALSMTEAESAGVLGACLFALMMLLFTAGRLLVGQIRNGWTRALQRSMNSVRTVNPPGWTCSMSIPTTMSAEFESIQASLVALTSELSRNYVRREELQDHLRDLRTRSQLLDENWTACCWRLRYSWIS